MRRSLAMIGALVVLAGLVAGGIWLHDRTQEVEAVTEVTTDAAEVLPERPVLQQPTVPVPAPAGPDSLPMGELDLEQALVPDPETVQKTVLVDSSRERTRLLVRLQERRTFFPEVRRKLFGIELGGGLSVEKIGTEGNPSAGGRVVVADVPEPAVALELTATAGAGALTLPGGGFAAGPALAVDLLNVYGIHAGGFAAVGVAVAGPQAEWGRLAAGVSLGVEILPRMRLHAGVDLIGSTPRPAGALGYRF